jgi:hypothetical protein
MTRSQTTSTPLQLPFNWVFTQPPLYPLASVRDAAPWARGIQTQRGGDFTC